MSWPCRPETYVAADRDFGPESYAQAQVQQAAVANAVVEFEPVLMLVRPEQLGEARRMLSSRIELLEIELDDSWMRDNGPIFVRDARGAGRACAVRLQRLGHPRPALCARLAGARS